MDDKVLDDKVLDDKVLDKATIETFLVSNFKMIYGEEEVYHMENTLKKHLHKKYPKNDDLFEFYNKIDNPDKENEKVIHDVKEEFCKSHTMKRAKSHDPKSLLLLARFFNAIGDCRLASECLWGSADMAVKKFIDDQRLGGVRGVKLVSHVAKERFVKEACDLEKEFDTIAKFHRSFYTDEYNRHDVGIGIGHAEAFVNRLEGYGEIDAAKKTELKRTDFNAKDYGCTGN